MLSIRFVTTYTSKDEEYAVVDGPVYMSEQFIKDKAQFEQDYQTWLELGNWRVPAPKRPEEKTLNIGLPYVSSPRQVQYIAYHLMKRSELGATIKRGADIEMFRYTPGDIVREVYVGDLAEISGVYEIRRIADAEQQNEYEIELLEFDNSLFAFPGEQ